ncbi:GNAT family N-acetyltransferase [Paracoccus xiamenensis]|uniref:GNAT family N-acetyltransferase n=1 Tax=Paracoccus xiamenensis TaxID=2714901 RepID=UPI00140BF671|nr:GNAT family N-acetyltransferase [Paracoccus xiamenensis]NHF74281.1 GNAT family N-acetyltransferase [Paracoccus xiamenensis]
MSYQFRAANDGDRDRIAKIWHSSASLPDVGPPTMPSFDDLRARVDEEMATGWVVTVAEGDTGLIAFLAIKPEQRYLDQLFVCPRHLGAGIGTALMNFAKRAMPDGFTLYTTSRNARARHFYEREGLVWDRDGAHPRAGHPISFYRWDG